MNGWISATSSSVIDFDYNLRRHSRHSAEIKLFAFPHRRHRG
jgi:hypothetical protein